MEISAVIPLLRIFDLTKAREFYIGFLGFKVDWEHRFEHGLPVYMQISRESNLVLHLTEHHGDCCPGSTVYIRVRKGLEEFHKELNAKSYGYGRPGLEVKEWGEKSMEVHDPFGNRLRFAQKIEVEEAGTKA